MRKNPRIVDLPGWLREAECMAAGCDPRKRAEVAVLLADRPTASYPFCRPHAQEFVECNKPDQEAIAVARGIIDTTGHSSPGMRALTRELQAKIAEAIEAARREERERFGHVCEPECRHVTRAAYEGMIAEDVEWLRKQPRSLEREHIEAVLACSADREYGRKP